MFGIIIKTMYNNKYLWLIYHKNWKASTFLNSDKKILELVRVMMLLGILDNDYIRMKW